MASPSHAQMEALSVYCTCKTNLGALMAEEKNRCTPLKEREKEITSKVIDTFCSTPVVFAMPAPDDGSRTIYVKKKIVINMRAITTERIANGITESFLNHSDQQNSSHLLVTNDQATAIANLLYNNIRKQCIVQKEKLEIFRGGDKQPPPPSFFQIPTTNFYI